jgi:hypothetical protein
MVIVDKVRNMLGNRMNENGASGWGFERRSVKKETKASSISW